MNEGKSLDRSSESFDGCNFALTENPHMKRLRDGTMTANGLVHGGCIPCGPGSDDVVTLSWRVRCRRIGRSAPNAACWSRKKYEDLGPRHRASQRVTLVMYFLRGLC